MTYWKPIDGVPYWVVDESQGNVFTICYNKESINKSEAMKKAADFLYQYSNRMEMKL